MTPSIRLSMPCAIILAACSADGASDGGGPSAPPSSDGAAESSTPADAAREASPEASLPGDSGGKADADALADALAETRPPPRCGDGERYAIIDADTVRDGTTGLVWMRSTYTLSEAGAQFTQVLAETYCSSLSPAMRLPTLDEAMGIAADSFAPCAFSFFTTWTSTVPEAGYAYLVSADGTKIRGVADNYPGWVLCVR